MGCRVRAQGGSRQEYEEGVEGGRHEAAAGRERRTLRWDGEITGSRRRADDSDGNDSKEGASVGDGAGTGDMDGGRGAAARFLNRGGAESRRRTSVVAEAGVAPRGKRQVGKAHDR